MKDKLGREIEYLRVSVTDRCNMRCIYCQPLKEERKVPRENVLTYEEIAKVVRACENLGIDKVRLTGGEPLCRKDLSSLVSMIDENTDLTDLSLTTNGVFMEEKASPLARAGLDRVNISIDALDPEVFGRITCKDQLTRVLAGIKASKRSGLEPVKLNAVLMEGVNDGEIESLVEFSAENDLILRFIELMPMGPVENTELEGLSIDRVKSKLKDDGFKISRTEDPRGQGPAEYVKLKKGRLATKIGFIFPSRQDFCSGCNKIRITSQGRIRPCLAHDLEYDLGDVKNKKPGDLEDLISEAIKNKPLNHGWKKGSSTEGEMSKIGG